MGNSANWVVVREEMRWADSYIVERGLSMSQRPPTPEDASYPSKAIPAFCSARAAARPDGPAPMMAYRCSCILHTPLCRSRLRNFTMLTAAAAALGLVHCV